jgi:hypothetical protein
MKKFWLGFGAGIATTFLLFVGFWYVMYWRAAGSTTILFAIARQQVKEALPGTRVLDVQMKTSPESSAIVNYVHDHLYDVTVTYERRGKVKTIVVPYGITGKTWITPQAKDLVILDDQAQIIHELRGS